MKQSVYYITTRARQKQFGLSTFSPIRIVSRGVADYNKLLKAGYKPQYCDENFWYWI